MILPSPTIDTAEYVSPGHPDRLADAIAERLVEFGQSQAYPDSLSRSLVGVEVAVHDRTVFIDGRMALDGPSPPPVPLKSIVREAYAAAGYGVVWGPHPDELNIIGRVCEERLSPEEADIRPFSDDQSVVHGYAIARPETNYLPAAHWLAHRLGRALRAYQASHANRYGPDFKILVDVEDLGTSVRWRRLVLSLQHVAGVPMEAQHRELLPVIQGCLEAAKGAGLAGSASSFQVEHLHLNGAGDFVIGGPRGDNGLSGKKLVVDHYGPSVPIGGGALFGKDAWKVDRCGPLRARQLARQHVRAGHHQALVTLGWAPGEATPDLRQIYVQSQPHAHWHVADSSGVPDPSWFSIKRIAEDLRLNETTWSQVLRDGTFLGGCGLWEQI
jgi:S-adenosylmethionine synthetase